MIDSFDLIRDIYRVEETRYRKNVAELIELLDPGEILKTPVRTLSLGQRMRCEMQPPCCTTRTCSFWTSPRSA